MIAQGTGSKHAVVVGGGLAGLAAATDLSTRGVRVTLVEGNTHVGGKMNVLEEQGYTFDMGPTILTLPEVLCGIIRRTGRRVEDLIELVRLDPQWRCHYEDGVVLDLMQSVDAMAATIEASKPGAGEGYKKFIDFARRMNRLSRDVFFYKDVGGIADVMRQTPLGDPSIMMDALAMRLHSTVAKTAHGMVSEPHARQMIEHFLQYVGSSPFLAPAILSMIASAQVDQGCWYAMGGTRRVARTLETLARDNGVEMLTGVRVSRIRTEGTEVRGVELADGRSIEADVVVSNCDVQRTYRDLIGTPEGLRAHRGVASKYTPACSGVVLYLGLDRWYEHLAHHNFLFSKSSESEFTDIYDRGEPAKDPTLYIAAPSRTDPAQAPEGGEALYILVHTPYLRERHRWATEDGKPGPLLEQYRPVILDKCKRMGMDDIEDHIVVERSLTPAGIERMYNAEGGAIYGLASHGRLGGGFKPKNRSKAFSNLYFAGGSANPGPGVPMVLMSGVTAAKVVCEDLGVEAPAIDSTAHVPGEGEFREQSEVVSALAGV
ncbi:MAG: phytoene desaturase family protein [Planctomycetota bacterium]